MTALNHKSKSFSKSKDTYTFLSYVQICSNQYSVGGGIKMAVSQLRNGCVPPPCCGGEVQVLQGPARRESLTQLLERRPERNPNVSPGCGFQLLHNVNHGHIVHVVHHCAWWVWVSTPMILKTNAMCKAPTCPVRKWLL